MDPNTNTPTITTAPEAETKPPEKSSTPVVKPDKPKQTFNCLVCRKSYSKKTSLFTHHKTHPEHCVHCGENRGSSVENIYEHNQKHINIRPFICKICGESFLRNQQFVEHEKSHDKPPEEPAIKESKYKCKTCEHSYTNWKLFYKHQQDSGHYNEKFLCEICGSDFNSNFLLSQHIRRLHKRTDETFPCPSCSKVFASKPNLDSHVKKIHQNDNKTHRCETCLNTFSSASNLKQHVKIAHEVEHEYECQTCKKPFKAKNRLTRHEREVHLGKNGNPDDVRIFNCDHCQKKYKRSWHQARHSQMKHENSNASTATTTSSAGTPPIGTSPEINGNVIMTNNNFSYQQQIPQMPSSAAAAQPPLPDLNQVPVQSHHQQIHHQQSNAIISQNQQQQHTVNNVWNPMNSGSYGSSPTTSEMDQQSKAYPSMGTGINGEYVHYAVNEQYSNKFDIQPTPPPVQPVQASYDSWNQHQPAAWDYNQSHHMQPMYHQDAQASNWYYDQANAHAMYSANAYNNYKTDYNCLNQPVPPPPVAVAPPIHQPIDTSTMYNGTNYYYHPQTNPDPYAINHQMNPSLDYQHSNFHTNYHNNM